MGLQNYLLLGGGLVALFLAWPYISKKLANIGPAVPQTPPPQIVPEIDPAQPLTFRHTSVRGKTSALPDRPAGFRRSSVQHVGQLSSRFPKGGVGNCHYPSPGTVCWNSTCIPFNAKSSDASSVSGRQTLCSRARSKYMAQNVGSKSLSYVGQRIGMA
jgi:hypothetical protein